MTSPGLFDVVSGIDRVFVLGSQLSGDIKEALLSAQFDTSMDQVTQLTLKFIDPGWNILSSGLLLPGMRVDLEDYRLQITTLETEDSNGTEGFTIKCRPESVRALKDLRGAKVMSNVSPTQYLATECNSVNVKYVAQPSTKRSQIARDIPEPGQTYNTPPSAWTTIQRLAEEIGYVFYECADTVYFGQPTWLINNVQLDMVEAGYKVLDEANMVDEIPSCTKSLDNPYTSVSLVFPTNRLSRIRPGKRLNLQGVPLFSGQYLVSGMSIDLANPGARLSVDAETPHDPEPRPPSTNSASSGSSSSSFSGGSTTRTGTKSAEDFVAWAMKQIGDKYVYGASPKVSDPDPKSFDCSALVQWALGRVGVTGCPRTANAQIAWATKGGGSGVGGAINAAFGNGREISVSTAVRVRGALLWHDNHVAISLGNGKTVEAANSRVGVISGSNITGRFLRAAQIPQLHY